jgi:hypothetical protein
MTEIPVTEHEMLTENYFDLNAKCSELLTDLNETSHMNYGENSSRW